MAAPVSQPRGTSVESCRRVVCEQFARLAMIGCGQFRVRWLPGEERVVFEGQRSNRWESLPSAQLTGAEAKGIAAILADIRDKRNADVEVGTRQKPDYESFVVRVTSATLRRHERRLPEFLYSQLFWD